MATGDLFNDINHAVLDLQAADLQTYPLPLKRLGRLLNHQDLAEINEALVEGLDLEAFIKAGEESHRGIGSADLPWPDDDRQIIGLQLLLVQKFAENPRYMADFGHTFLFSGRKIMGSVDAVTSQIIIPFSRDYKAYVMNQGNANARLILPTSNKVFIVHGHDVGAREMVARFLETLKLEPIILLEQPDSGQTIIEKFEVHASTVSFAVILLTPDDLGGAAADAGQAERARQNVIYELGYFAGKLGRGRACLLRKGKVDMPSDLAGVIYTDLDAADGWKLKLIRELKAAGFNVDANKAWK